MPGRVKVFRRVFVWRRVAAADMAAVHAEAQMHPRGADAQTVFTAVGAGCYVFDLIEMRAVHVRYRKRVACQEKIN